MALDKEGPCKGDSSYRPGGRIGQFGRLGRVGRAVGWSGGGLVVCLICELRLVGWLVGRSVGRSAGRSVGRSVGRSASGLIGSVWNLP